MKELKQFAIDDKKQALEQLKQVKETERARAVKEVQEFTQKVADKRVREIREEHKAEVAKYGEIVASWQDEVKARESSIQQLEVSKVKVGEKLLEVKYYFQDFINRVKLFENGQTDYLLPPMYLEEIERNGVLSKPL